VLNADCFAFSANPLSEETSMNTEELKKRTKQFGLRCIKVAESLPNTRTGDVLSKQLVRSATSVGANYRSACRAQSKPTFISKIAIAIEEVDEAQFWLEMIVEAGLMPQKKLADLMKESDEIVAILTASSKTAKANLRKSINNQKSTIRNQS
jgi:four helix bundle protein